jgi:hypothetical protein
MQQTVSFLAAPGEYLLELPDEIDTTPDATSTILSFGGYREIGYAPVRAVRLEDILETFAHKFDADFDGFRVSFFERRESPPTLVALWRLNAGFLSTFMDEPTSEQTALEAVVRGIGIDVGSGVVPRLKLRHPVSRPDLSYEPFRDIVGFYPKDPTSKGWPTIRIVEEPLRRKVKKGGEVEGDGAVFWVARPASRPYAYAELGAGASR